MIATRDRQILHIALPSIVSNITVPLLGLVDVAIVGHMGDASYIGAIAVGGMMFNIVYWIFGFLRMGTGGLTSQALGRRNLKEVVRLLLRSAFVAGLLGLALLIFQWPLRELMFFLIRPESSVRALTTTYYNICIWGAPAMMLLYCLTGWFIGMQNTRIPMLVAIFQNVMNIVASLLLVYVGGLKVEGVALGTVIAQYSGLLLAVGLLIRHYKRLDVYADSHRLLNRHDMWLFFQINRDIFLRTLCLVAVNLFFTAVGAAQGAVVLAVNTLLMQLYLLFSYVMDGFAYAAEALGGRLYGARNGAGFRLTLHRVFVWGGVMTVLFTTVYVVAGNDFLALLTDDSHVRSLSAEFYYWAALVPIAGVAAFVWDGVFIGITATRGMLAASAVASVVFFILYEVLHGAMGNHALWLAFVVYLLMRGGVQTLWYARFYRPEVRSMSPSACLSD